MRSIRRTAAVSLGLALLLSGCGERTADDVDGGSSVSTDAQQEPADPDDPGGQDAPEDSGEGPGGGGPLNRNEDNEAQGSPLNIPALTEVRSGDIVLVRARLEDEIRRRCGGSLCVQLRERRGPNELMVCQFESTDPSGGTLVERGSIVYIVTGSAPCKRNSNGEISPDESPSTEPPVGGSESGEPGVAGAGSGEDSTNPS
jgi:hypothetical protein